MAKYDACVVSAFTSAGAFVVTTCDALLYGVTGLGSAAATIVNVHQGVNTGGTKKFVASFDVTAGVNEGPSAPIVCAGGITATNVGTVATYAVLYANL